jgi:hypothetical protein
MARVERFFERLVERPAARVFRARLQPVQVLRRIEREMEGARQRIGDRTMAPDRFVVRLAADDLVALGAPDALAERLASGALAFARSHGLLLRDRPSVVLETDPEAGRGDVEVSAAFSPPRVPLGGDVVGGDGIGDLGGTQVFEVPVVRAPSATLEIAEAGRAPRLVPVEPRPATIGRGTDCDVVLADAHASRHHARLDVRGGVIVLTDLGSTNGTRVNGRRVREVVLGVGDRIEVGQTFLRVLEGDAASGAVAPSHQPPDA